MSNPVQGKLRELSQELETLLQQDDRTEAKDHPIYLLHRDKKQNITALLPKTLIGKAKGVCKQLNISVTELLHDALMEKIDNLERESGIEYIPLPAGANLARRGRYVGKNDRIRRALKAVTKALEESRDKVSDKWII